MYRSSVGQEAPGFFFWFFFYWSENTLDFLATWVPPSSLRACALAITDCWLAGWLVGWKLVADRKRQTCSDSGSPFCNDDDPQHEEEPKTCHPA